MSETAALRRPRPFQGQSCNAPRAATTPDDVRAWLVSLFLELPTAPVYAASRSKVGFVDPDKSPSAFDWPTFAADVLGPRSRERLWLLTWARCEARRQALARNLPNPPAGGTISDFCREAGIHGPTLYRTVNRSLAVLAREWDRRQEGRNPVRPEDPDPAQAIAHELGSEVTAGDSVPDPGLEKARIFRPPVSTTQS